MSDRKDQSFSVPEVPEVLEVAEVAERAEIPEVQDAPDAGGGMEDYLPLVYDELRRLAGRYLGRRGAGQTLQPTGLVHEAYLRLLDQTKDAWDSRAHFFRIAAQAMRRVLVDYCRSRRAQKRGGGVWVTLSEGMAAGSEPAVVNVLAVDAALDKLAGLDTRQAQIVELRFFAGLTVAETATALDISPATVKREWALAKAWMFLQLKASPSPPADG